jgi:hypothetical protein
MTSTSLDQSPFTFQGTEKIKRGNRESGVLLQSVYRSLASKMAACTKVPIKYRESR